MQKVTGAQNVSPSKALELANQERRMEGLAFVHVTEKPQEDDQEMDDTRTRSELTNGGRGFYIILFTDVDLVKRLESSRGWPPLPNAWVPHQHVHTHGHQVKWSATGGRESLTATGNAAGKSSRRKRPERGSTGGNKRGRVRTSAANAPERPNVP